MQVIVDGLLTHYELSGQGKVVVLLHGWGDRAAGLDILRAALAKHFTVVVPDLPGFGGTPAPAGVWDLADYARFVAAFLRKLEKDRVYAYVGHSNGGAIAIRGLAQGIIRADELVLLASAGIRDSYKGRSKALRMVVKAGKVLTSPLPSSVKKRLRRGVYTAIGSDMLVAEHLQETFKRIVTDDVQADAAKLALPTLLVYGEADTATPVGYGERFHELITGSTLEVLPGAGHFIHMDRPRDVIRAVEEFLR